MHRLKHAIQAGKWGVEYYKRKCNRLRVRSIRSAYVYLAKLAKFPKLPRVEGTSSVDSLGYGHCMFSSRANDWNWQKVMNDRVKEAILFNFRDRFLILHAR